MKKVIWFLTKEFFSINHIIIALLAYFLMMAGVQYPIVIMLLVAFLILEFIAWTSESEPDEPEG